MGLDQNAWKVNPENKDERVELCYWRKHNRLQGWMEQLWIEKGQGTQEQLAEGMFNMVDLALTMEDIIRLEKDVVTLALPETQGFFYGGDSYRDVGNVLRMNVEDGTLHAEVTEQDMPWPYRDYQTDKEFITDAKIALDQGYDVIYSCWW